MTAEQPLVLALPAGMVVVESVGKPAVVRRSEASARPVRGSRTGQNAKVSLIDATNGHSPAAVDLPGPALLVTVPITGGQTRSSPGRQPTSLGPNRWNHLVLDNKTERNTV